MKPISTTLVLSLIACLPTISCAESGAKTELKKPVEISQLQKDLKGVVDERIREVSAENEGAYPLDDTLHDTTIDAELVKFDWSAMRHVADDEKIVRAEFKAMTQVILVDYTLRFEDKEWQINDETIISIDGIDRFVYNNKHERAPIHKTADIEDIEEDDEEYTLDDEFALPENSEDIDGDTKGI